jgi:hypothetical protein
VELAGRATPRAESALLIALVTSRNASSTSGHFVIGLPSLGAASRRPNGASCQSHGRRMTGMTLHSPASCRSSAREHWRGEKVRAAAKGSAAAARALKYECHLYSGLKPRPRSPIARLLSVSRPRNFLCCVAFGGMRREGLT